MMNNYESRERRNTDSKDIKLAAESSKDPALVNDLEKRLGKEAVGEISVSKYSLKNMEEKGVNLKEEGLYFPTNKYDVTVDGQKWNLGDFMPLSTYGNDATGEVVFSKVRDGKSFNITSYNKDGTKNIIYFTPKEQALNNANPDDSNQLPFQTAELVVGSRGGKSKVSIGGDYTGPVDKNGHPMISATGQASGYNLPKGLTPDQLKLYDINSQSSVPNNKVNNTDIHGLPPGLRKLK